MKMERKNKTLGWKLEKGNLEQKQEIFEDSQAKRTEEWKGNDRTAPEAFMRSSTPSKTKIWTLCSRTPSSKFSNL